VITYDTIGVMSKAEEFNVDYGKLNPAHVANLGKELVSPFSRP